MNRIITELAKTSLVYYILFLVFSDGDNTPGKSNIGNKNSTVPDRKKKLTLKARTSTFGSSLSTSKSKHKKEQGGKKGLKFGSKVFKNISSERLAAYGLGSKRKRPRK